MPVVRSRPRADHIHVKGARTFIVANETWGAVRALETFSQLLYRTADRRVSLLFASPLFSPLLSSSSPCPSLLLSPLLPSYCHLSPLVRRVRAPHFNWIADGTDTQLNSNADFSSGLLS